jgi:hypothetical protein
MAGLKRSKSLRKESKGTCVNRRRQQRIPWVGDFSAAGTAFLFRCRNTVSDSLNTDGLLTLYENGATQCSKLQTVENKNTATGLTGNKSLSPHKRIP